VLAHAEVEAGIQADLNRARRAAAEKGRSPDWIGDFPGVAWSFAEVFENRWDKLPR
jgi:hypothetical protein